MDMVKPMEVGDDDNIIGIVVEIMEKVEKNVIINTGEWKKNYVMDLIKAKLGEETFNSYSPLIDGVIEFIISVSKGDVKIHINEIRKKFCCF